MTTLGVVYRPQFAPERLKSIAQAADRAGLAELWLWEDCFLSGGVSTAAAALSWTERLRVAIGIMPVPFRNVALTAMEIATLSRMFGDRVIPGLGHGVQDWMAQVGAKPASPMTLLREYTTALQALLRGEEVTVSGRYVSLDRVRLDWPPEPAPGVLIGATGPKTLALSGELAAGTILTAGQTRDPAGVAASVGHIAAGPGHRVVLFLGAATGPGAAERMAGDFPGDPAVHGDAEAIATGLRPWIEAGVDTIVLQPTADEPDPEGFVRFAATEVQPLIG